MHVIKKLRQTNEQGIVSLIVTIILMMVISLIVISFARTSLREQRDSLDRQLSTSAFYAAESGVNAARKAIKDNPSLISTNAQYISSCAGNTSFAQAASLSIPSANIGSPTSNATYTCLFVDPTVSSIERSRDTKPYSVTLRAAGGGNIGGLNISWDAGGSDFSGCPDMYKNPSTLTNCDAGILRFEITDLTNTRVYFIYPDGDVSTTVNTIDFTAPADTRVYKTKCGVAAAPQECQFKIDHLGAGPYYARVSSLYKPFELTIQPSSPDIEFEGAQVLIDATGKAADVQRRIQVRYSPDELGGPDNALQAGAAICKKFSVTDTDVDDGSGGKCWTGSPDPLP